MEERGMPLRLGVNGGMYKKERPEQKPLNYIAVESIDEYSRKIKALGGKIVIPKMEIAEIGWWSLATDLEGTRIRHRLKPIYGLVPFP